MTPVLRPPSSGYPTRSLAIYLLLSVSLTINTFRLIEAADLVSSASGLMCPHDCSPGFECKSGACQRIQCNQDCKDVAKNQLCGSNGVTYNNMCELEKARCELTQNIEKEYDGVCITLPPPPEQLCKAHQKEWDTRIRNESLFMLECNVGNVYAKGAAGTLQHSDIVYCYRPQCANDQYVSKQCSFLLSEWCWCSTPDGYALPNTFQRNMPDNYCSDRQTESCVVDGDTKNDGEVYTPKDICGLCECINGTHTCFVNYTVNDNGQLSNSSLENLKNQLIQVFNFQFNHKEHLQVDIRHINKYPTHVTESQKETILGWKFSHYDRNDDDVLNHFEEFIYHNELVKLFGCNKFFDHLTELTDTNGDNEITLQEWNDFFELNTSGQSSRHLAKREAVRRKPLHLRKKFRYTLQ